MAFESESRSSEQSERTSVSLEHAFWKSLREIASGRNVTVSDLVVSINGGRRQGNLSSAIRLFVLDYYRTHAVASQPSGH